jgi:hypothetical protein
MSLVRGLTTTGRKRGKQKFRNADEAARARELDRSWKELNKKWIDESESKRINRAMSSETLTYKLSVPAGRETTKLPSLNTGLAVATKAPDKVYTGTKMLGIGTMHKSNSVPIFSDEEAVSIATMRR